MDTSGDARVAEPRFNLVFTIRRERAPFKRSSLFVEGEQWCGKRSFRESCNDYEFEDEDGKMKVVLNKLTKKSRRSDYVPTAKERIKNLLSRPVTLGRFSDGLCQSTFGGMAIRR